MAAFFEGRYYKHQKDGTTICFIIGHTADTEFIQILTDDEVIQYNFLEGCKRYRNGIKLNYPEVNGAVVYGQLLPLRSHIMGPFHFLPMQCSHEVISMRHTLRGGFNVHGNYINLNDGLGYMEGDYGRSFPKEYLWLHCNDFTDDLSIMISVAHIPFCGLHFIGCICAIIYEGKEYRLATYRGVRIHAANENQIILKQGSYRLTVTVTPANSHPLHSPLNGKMVNTIHESTNTKAKFLFTKQGKVIFKESSEHCSFECNLNLKH